MKNKIILQNEKTLPSNWIPFLRDIADLYKNGKISKAEYFVYLHLRLNCNPYGRCSAHLEAIRDDVFGKSTGKKKVSVNYVNKIMLSLRSKRLLYYPDRAGKSGSFLVHFPDFITPDKKITNIAHLFESDHSNCNSDTGICMESEVIAEVQEENQRLELSENSEVSNSKLVDENKQFRGYNNDNDIQNKIDNTDISVSHKEESKGKTQPPYVCKNPTDSFVPVGYEKNTAVKIANAVGEKCMDRYLSLIRQNQFWVLEKAFGEYTEDMSKNTKITDPPAYLNGIITRMLKASIAKNI